jgi:hypothetical protein
MHRTYSAFFVHTARNKFVLIQNRNYIQVLEFDCMVLIFVAMYWLRFIFIATKFSFRLPAIRKQASIDATKHLHEVEERLGGKFDDFTFNKIVKSHSLYLHIVNDSFTALHGRFTNNNEQLRSINYFTCSSVFDNFWDNKTHTLEELKAISFQPETYQPKTFDDRAFLESHLLLKNYVKDKVAYENISQKVFLAQQLSLKQFDKDITNETIQHITFEKGGNSVLLCRYYLDIQPTKEEEQCWYLLGTMIQLTNDLFDTYKDLQHNSYTLATRCTNVYEVENIYLNQIAQLKHCITQLPYKKTRKRYFSIIIASTYTLGLVAIEQLKKIQSNDASMPDLRYLPRKVLIIDMEKFSNVWLWVKLIFKYGKL